MRIKIQFITSTLVFAAIAAGISTSMFLVNQGIRSLDRQHDTAIEVERSISELGYLSNDYLLFGEEQQRARWETRFLSFSSALSELAPDDPEQQAVVDNMRKNAERLRAVFNEVVSAF